MLLIFISLVEDDLVLEVAHMPDDVPIPTAIQSNEVAFIIYNMKKTKHKR
jgi:hypothetical protein